MRPKNGHLNVINRLDAALSFNIGDREKIQLLSSILEEMMALDVEPLIKTRYENLTTSTEIEELLQDQIYSINRESSDLCRKYINVLKSGTLLGNFRKERQ